MDKTQAGHSLPSPSRIAHILFTWLCVVCGFIFVMVIIGAITRLTESGLSITYWKPITGTLPPLSEAAWQAEFDLYRTSPEYIHKNAGMSLADFKFIYFWEWLHRLWGRLIGLVYAVPLAIFMWRGWIPRRELWIYGGLLALGGLQGFMGWYMVQSGLVDEPRVSHYRLAMHLGLALAIFALCLWQALRLRRQSLVALHAPQPHEADNLSPSLRYHGFIAMAFLVITIIWGAFVAGLDAGLIYNEWPLMGAGLIPPEMFHAQPWWINFFENHASVQFTHRWLGLVTFLAIFSWAVRLATRTDTHRTAGLLAVAILLQFFIGISTLLSGVWLPLAVLHQAGAVIVLTGMVIALYQVGSRCCATAPRVRAPRDDAIS